MTEAQGRTLVTARELAEQLSCHPRTIPKWMDEGMPVAERGRGGRPSKFDLEQCREWSESRRAAESDDLTAVDLIRERARKERAQAALAEQLYATRQKDLLPRADVEKAWSAEVAAVRSILLAMPQKYADRVHRAGTRNSVAGVEDMLKQMAHEVLRELADPSRPSEPPAEVPESKKPTKRRKRAA